MAGMKEAHWQRIIRRIEKVWMADPPTLEADIVMEHTDASCWYHKHFDRVKPNGLLASAL